MLRFERTHDLALVKQVLTHPKIWPHITDDGCGAPEDFEPVDHPGFWYVVVENGTLQGIFTFQKQNSVCWEVHTCLLPSAWGKLSKEAATGVREWVWQNANTDKDRCDRIVTSVPAYNRLAFRLAKASGMKEYGLNPKAFLRDGVLHDLILLGVSKCQRP